MVSSHPARPRVDIDTYGGGPIDIELPASVSGQHVVNFHVNLDMLEQGEGDARPRHIRTELSLPVHLRYPDPGCERLGEECEGYAWIQVSEQ